MIFMLPHTDESVFVVRALKTLALADGEIHPQERRLIEVAAEAMDVDLDLDAYDFALPEEAIADEPEAHIGVAAQ